jgi:hypothetical protein
VASESFWLSKLPDWLAKAWGWFRDVWALIRVSRFAVLGVIILAVFMLVTPQGREILLSIADDEATRPHSPLFVLLITTFFAVNVWTWARLMVSYRYLPPARGVIDQNRLVRTFERLRNAGKEPSAAFVEKRKALPKINEPVVSDQEMTEWMVRLPRILGVLVYLITAGSLFIAYVRFGPSLGSENSLELLFWSLVIAAAGILFYLVVRYRRDAIEWIIVRYLRPERRATTPSLTESVRDMLADSIAVMSQNDVRERWQWCAWSDLSRNTKWYLLALTGLLVAACVWGIVDPGSFGRSFGSAGTVFLGLAFWMCAGTWVLFWLDHRRFPVITVAFVWALVLNVFGDNHALRVVEVEAESKGTSPSLQRSPVADAAGAWRRHVPASADGAVLRPVIAATAGGGIRAGYWTATVLAKLDDEVPGFRDNLFAISGVSGGGLGAAAYLAARGGEGCENAGGRVAIGEATLGMLSDDFLAPTLGGLFYRDFVARLLPVWFIPDRADALERSWSHSWTTTCPASDGTFDKPFLGLWSGEGFRPALLVNGTMVHTGRRIITSNLTVRPDVFREAHDFYDYFDRGDVPLSTAVHNGARFTYVSPAGKLSAEVVREGKTRRVVTGQIIDGGYFENFGADTAAELLVALMSALRPQQEQHVEIRPIVIQISSEPGLEAVAEYDGSDGGPASTARHSGTFVPVIGFMKTRGARGVNAMKRLHRMTVEVYKGTFAHFRLCKFEDLEEPPLGWVLSQAARSTIAKHFDLTCQKPVEHSNVGELKRVRRALD